MYEDCFYNSVMMFTHGILTMLNNLHELRYFQEVVALAPEVDTLLSVKARYIHDSTFRYPEGLKIYFNGKEEWIFDEKITPQNAVRYF